MRQKSGVVEDGARVFRMETNGRDTLRSSFTAREREVLHLLRQGYSNKSIAHELEISQYTVRDHVSSLMRKTRTANRVQLAMWNAGQYGLS